jgi:superfamily II RNA helicase
MFPADVSSAMEAANAMQQVQVLEGANAELARRVSELTRQVSELAAALEGAGMEARKARDAADSARDALAAAESRSKAREVSLQAATDQVCVQ